MKKVSLFFLLIFAFNVYSHEFNPAHLNLKQSLVDNSTYTGQWMYPCLLYTSPSPRDAHESRMPSSA